MTVLGYTAKRKVRGNEKSDGKRGGGEGKIKEAVFTGRSDEGVWS